MQYEYSDKRNIQILISLMKAYQIKKVVVSPGATHMNFVASVQRDPFFQLYSEIDERNAGYIACGLAAETGEPVAIACTGATASRDYYPALTEAYYRKLPILAVTGTQDMRNVGNLSPQMIERGSFPADLVRMSVTLQPVESKTDEWNINLKVNKALSELFRNGGGPVHINLTTEYASDTFSANSIPDERVIRRFTVDDTLPELEIGKKIAITVGAHKKWSDVLTDAVDRFCAVYDAIVLVDHSSGYHGKYRVLATIAATQERYRTDLFDTDLLIHIGEQSGDYYVFGRLPRTREVWRISEDGEFRDTFRKLTNVFEMSELMFFQHYAQKDVESKHAYYDSAVREISELYQLIPKLPFSNIMLAHYLSSRLPVDSVLHLGVSNTMRSWTFFDLVNHNPVWANIGCRGIDGALPTAVGMSFANPDRIHFCVLGDLTFFYGLNALGNRDISGNLRILLVNNGRGTEFRMYQHKAEKALGEDADPYIAAAGHFGNQSKTFVRDLATNLGFTYLTASTEEEFQAVSEKFVSPEIGTRPILLEVFTDSVDEDEALKIIRNLVSNIPDNPEPSPQSSSLRQSAKRVVKSIIGEEAYRRIRKQ